MNKFNSKTFITALWSIYRNGIGNILRKNNQIRYQLSQILFHVLHVLNASLDVHL